MPLSCCSGLEYSRVLRHSYVLTKLTILRKPLYSSLTAPACAALLLLVGDGASANSLEILQQRVKRQENLLQRCKETIQSRKEQCTLLTSEKEALQEQLDERLQELEKIKVKSKCVLFNVAPSN